MSRPDSEFRISLDLPFCIRSDFPRLLHLLKVSARLTAFALLLIVVVPAAMSVALHMDHAKLPP